MVQAETGTDLVAHQRIGAQLAAARVAQALELEDVAQRTRVPLRHLETIERGDAVGLPATPYAIGFAKSYARVVGLDPQVVAKAFRVELDEAAGIRPYAEQFEPADPKRVPPLALAIIALVLAVLVGGSYIAWRSGAFGGDTAEQRAQLAAGTAPAEEAPIIQAAPPTGTAPIAAPPPAGTPTGQVSVTAIEPVWLKIYDAGNATLFMGEMAAGQRFDVPPAANGPMIWTGRPQAVRLAVGTTVIPPIGSPEQTIRDVSLAPAALLQRLQTGNVIASPVAQP